MAQAVKGRGAPRTRRAERAEQTRRRIIEAATGLFAQTGFAGTTIEAIAAQADVAVETVYSRFGNKATLLEAILGPAITGTDDGRPVLELPEMTTIRETADQREQLRMLAHLSRTILQRTHQVHRILQAAAAADTRAAELQGRDLEYRTRTQREYIDILVANGPIRADLTLADAGDTYAALANPTNYAFLTGERGWSPDQFEKWLADSLIRLLLPSPLGAMPG